MTHRLSPLAAMINVLSSAKKADSWQGKTVELLDGNSKSALQTTTAYSFNTKDTTLRFDYMSKVEF